MTSQSSQGSASIQQGLEASYEHSTINVGMRSGARCINVSGLCWSMFAGGHPIQNLIDGKIHAKVGAATAPESTAAKTHHQPTPSSIAAAEAEHGQLSPEEFTAVNAAMAQALKADGAGDRSACEQALADAKRLLGSAGTQTQHQ